MKFDVITIGGATEDITFYTKEGVIIDNKEDLLRQKLIAFEYGAKIKIDKAYSTFGGGASNAAVCLALLGFKVASLVAVGDDNRGLSIINNFQKKGVDTTLVQKIKNIESGFSLLLVGQKNEHVVFSNRAANTKLAISNYEINFLHNTKWVYMTSLSGNWQAVLNKVFSVKNVKIAWNPGHIQLKSGLKTIGKFLKKSYIVIVNKDEAIELAISDPKGKKDRKHLNDMKNLLETIKKWVPGIVIITNGKSGADAYDGEKFYHQDIMKEKKLVDTTGVGDAFGSTFLAGLEIFSQDIAKAMKMSVANTASIVSQLGAQNGLLTKTEILKKI